MPLYEDAANCENKIKISAESASSFVFGTENTISKMVDVIRETGMTIQRTAVIALEGWYGVDWKNITEALTQCCKRQGIDIDILNINTTFKGINEIAEYKKPFISDDPSFGVVNEAGLIKDLMDMEKVDALKLRLQQIKTDATGKLKVQVVYGSGAAISELIDVYDVVLYFEKTRAPLLWQIWDGKLIPFGVDEEKSDYYWKEYYYCDYYLLDRQKEFAIERMDYYIEAINFDDLKLVPRKAFDEMLYTLVSYPIKGVRMFQPGPWGAYRYKDLFNVPGLECNAWNRSVGPELSMLIDVGRGKFINMPFVNVMQYGEKVVGALINKTYPKLFPFEIWLDDGYFSKPESAERTSMPIHSHPSSEYVKRHFKEPLGRYETYYIAEAYEGANTWMGFKENADLEEWEAKCMKSNNITPIENWKDYIANWQSNVGDLYLIPPGTTHCHGGNQMVLEMDTSPSLSGTEYSFFTYDFARNTWDDNTKTMTAAPCKMHLEHGFDNEKWCRESYVNNNLRAKPKLVKWTREYCKDEYSSLPQMPYTVERFHFNETAPNDTENKFTNVVTLTVGEKIKIRSKSNPDREAEIGLYQSIVIPACFGEYEFINMSKGHCTVVQFRWKLG